MQSFANKILAKITELYAQRFRVICDLWFASLVKTSCSKITDCFHDTDASNRCPIPLTAAFEILILISKGAGDDVPPCRLNTVMAVRIQLGIV